MQQLTWQQLTNLGTVVFGSSLRTATPGGWLVVNKPGPSTATDKLATFVPDPNGLWTSASLTWTFVTDISNGKTLGSTYRAAVPGGWLVGNVLGSTGSSRSFTYLSDTNTVWLADAPPPPPPPSPTPPTIGAISNQSLTQGVAFSFVPTVTNPSSLALNFSLVGTLPAGLVFSTSNGAITGTPTVTGTVNGLQIQVMSSGGNAVSNSFSVNVTAAALTSKWIGTNLMEVRDWSTDFPFTNHFYKVRQWISGSVTTWDTGGTVSTDSLGNILSLQSGQIARGVLFTAARPVVDFDLTWTGSATIAWNGGTVKSSAANHLVVTPAASGNVWIEITAVDATNPPKNITLKRVDQASVTSFFNPDFLTDMKKYALIRFMDWGQTNYTRTATQLQSDFSKIGSLPISFAGTGQGVPLDVMLQLCNEANVHGWFCINVGADSTYITTYLNAIKAKLAPGLKAYVELSNEVWNSMFPQYTAIGGSTFDVKMGNYASRAADLAAQTKSILGSQGVAVLGSQDTATYWQEQLIVSIKNAGKTVPDVIATAPYFGLGLADATTIYSDGSLLASVNSEIANVKATRAIADKYGIGLVSYEGGCSVMPGINVNRDSRIGAMYSTYLSGIKPLLSGGIFPHYAFCSDYGSSGSWGVREYEYQTPTSPKEAAVLAAM